LVVEPDAMQMAKARSAVFVVKVLSLRVDMQSFEFIRLPKASTDIRSSENQ
jgi:hypothetical protein